MTNVRGGSEEMGVGAWGGNSATAPTRSVSVSTLHSYVSMPGMPTRYVSASTLPVSVSTLHSYVSVSNPHTLTPEAPPPRRPAIHIYIIRMQLLAIMIYIVSPCYIHIYIIHMQLPAAVGPGLCHFFESVRGGGREATV